MILQSLNEHYYRLLEDKDSGIASPGYSLVDISFVLVLSADGSLLDMIEVELKEMVPEHKKRQGINPPPYFLCDKILYSLGIGINMEEGSKRFEQYKAYQLKILKNVDSIEAKALISFLESWNSNKWRDINAVYKYQDTYNKVANLNTVYKIEGMSGYVHQNSKIQDAWLTFQDNETNKERMISQCLITGEITDIARTHEVAIKGAGGQPSGTALVSFQIDSFRSYGKTQSYNAPVGKKAAFAYGTALNYLLSSKSNHIRCGDTTMVFWADRRYGGKQEEKLLSWLLEPIEAADNAEDDENRRIDMSSVRQAKNILERLRDGLPVDTPDFNPGVRCYILGLAPNASRLSVRFWEVSSFGELLRRVGQHYNDMQITGIEKVNGYVPVWKILKNVAVQGKSENIPPLLGGQVMRSILTGQAYPSILYTSVIQRCRSGGDYGGVNTIRAGLIKAYLVRKFRLQKSKEMEGLVTMSLNEASTNTAYRLGRLFSLLEKAQRDALGNNINATIRDRYFGAASATPASVFPLLLRLSQHHMSKAEYGNLIDKRVQEVLGGIDIFPAHLDLEEQGLFILGYYHQNQANYIKNEKKEG